MHEDICVSCNHHHNRTHASAFHLAFIFCIHILTTWPSSSLLFLLFLFTLLILFVWVGAFRNRVSPMHVKRYGSFSKVPGNQGGKLITYRPSSTDLSFYHQPEDVGLIKELNDECPCR